MRDFLAQPLTSCLNVTITDELDAFEWLCDDSSVFVRAVSRRLKAGKNLSDLIDWSAMPIDFKKNRVIITANFSLAASNVLVTTSVLDNNKHGMIFGGAGHTLSNLAVANNGDFSGSDIGLQISGGGVVLHNLMTAVNSRTYLRDIQLTNSSAADFDVFTGNHGALMRVAAPSNGVIQGVTMYRYETNGH